MDERSFLYCPIQLEAQFGKREKRKKQKLSGPDIPRIEINARYNGEWLEHIETREGYGELLRANEEEYEGYFIKDKFSGKGKFTFKPRDEQKRKQYLGYFKEGKL